jgi:adenylate cyclase
MQPSPVERKLTAILCADVAGYSRMMGEDEEATLDSLTASRAVFSDYIQRYRGRVVNNPGDSILAEFASVVDAVACAAEIQRELAERNAELPEPRRMQFRIGINHGDVMVREGDLYGDGVNIAARVQTLADPGGICVSGKAHEEVKSKLPLEYQFLGRKEVKNIAEPVAVYRVLSRPGAAAHRVALLRRALAFPRRLARVAIFAALALAFVASGFLYWRQTSIPRDDVGKPALALPDKPSIAVLPLANLSGDPAQDYFGDGISEDIITGLTRFSNLFVIARNSTFQYKGKSVDVRTIGRDLGVRYVLEGAVRRASDRVRITAQLIDAASGAHVWAEAYDREAADLFEIQDEITREIVGKLGVQVDRAEFERTRSVPPNDMGAYDLVLQARPLLHDLSAPNHAKARDLLERAVKLDENYARAHAELAWIYLDEYRHKFNSRPNPMERALAAAQRAVELAPNDGFARWRLAKIHYYHRDFTQFDAEMQRALVLNPNDAAILADVSIHLTWLDRLEESYRYYQQAVRLDPDGPTWVRFIPTIYFYRHRRYDKSLAHALQINMPGFHWAYFFRAINYAQLGQMEKAREEAAEVLRLKPDFAYWDYVRLDNYPKVQSLHIAEGAAKAGLPLGKEP